VSAKTWLKGELLKIIEHTHIGYIVIWNLVILVKKCDMRMVLNICILDSYSYLISAAAARTLQLKVRTDDTAGWQPAGRWRLGRVFSE
jgi:hypothetical protein